MKSILRRALAVAVVSLLASLACLACRSQPSPGSDMGPHPGAAEPASGSAGPPGPPGSSAGSADAASEPPPTPDVLTLLDGLKPTDLLGPATVAHVSPVVAGKILVYVTVGAERGMAFIVKRDGPPSAPAPPVTSEKYAVYYQVEKSGPRGLSSGVLMEVCTALAERLRRTEARAPTPAGLTGFSPDVPAP